MPLGRRVSWIRRPMAPHKWPGTLVRPWHHTGCQDRYLRADLLDWPQSHLHSLYDLGHCKGGAWPYSQSARVCARDRTASDTVWKLSFSCASDSSRGTGDGCLCRFSATPARGVVQQAPTDVAG